jgi:hypothetical protein
MDARNTEGSDVERRRSYRLIVNGSSGGTDYIEQRMSEEANGAPPLDNLILGEIQVLLSEKRTSLSSLRTGIAIFALPLSVLSVLIATSKYYSITKVMPLLVPLLTLNFGLVVLGSWLIYRSMKHFRHY